MLTFEKVKSLEIGGPKEKKNSVSANGKCVESRVLTTPSYFIPDSPRGTDTRANLQTPSTLARTHTERSFRRKDVIYDARVPSLSLLSASVRSRSRCTFALK